MAISTGKGQWHPSYWNEQKHGNAWDRVKDALKRDWDQTKADVNAKGGKDLNQDVDNTVKQAIGTEPIPPSNIPNTEEYAKAELALQYGFGAHEEYGQTYADWNEDLETKLSKEWDAKSTGMKFDEAKPFVRRGWDYQK